MGGKPEECYLQTIPKQSGITQAPFYYAHGFNGQVSGQNIVGMGLPGSNVGKTQMIGSVTQRSEG